MKRVIHVHQQLIRQGAPAIIVRTYKGSTHHTNVDIVCKCGNVAATVIQTPEPDSCGARVRIETKEEVNAS